MFHALLFLLGVSLCSSPAWPQGSQRASTTDGPDYRNGWYHWATGSESLRAISGKYKKDPALVAELNRIKPDQVPPSGKAIYIPPVHDRAALVEILGRINKNPNIVPTAAPKSVAMTPKAQHPNRATTPPKSQGKPAAVDQRPARSKSRGGPPASPPARQPDPSDAPNRSGGFSWPIRGKVVREFSESGDAFFRGISIAAPDHSPVSAARDGEVLFAGDLKGYGKVVIVRHDSGYTSVYGFNDRILVASSQRVRAGEQIAMAGRPSASSESQLFFQIRRNDRPINPLGLLP